MNARRSRTEQRGAGRRAVGRVVTALGLVALLAGVWTSQAWAHGGHPHGGPGAGRAAADGELRARSARFDFDAPRPGTYRLPVIKPAADGAVVDAAGHARRLREALAGKVVVLSFIFTRCSDANGCPLATAVLHRLHAATADDPELARNLKLVTLSFDPTHDTPGTMAKYGTVAATQERRSTWEFLTTSSERELAPILAGYGQLVQRPAGPPVPGVTAASPTHLLRVYLIDRQQRVRNIYGLDFLDPRLLMADVQTLLLEERQAQR